MQVRSSLDKVPFFDWKRLRVGGRGKAVSCSLSRLRVGGSGESDLDERDMDLQLVVRNSRHDPSARRPD